MANKKKYDTTDPEFWKSNKDALENDGDVLYEESEEAEETTATEDDEENKTLRELFFSLPDGLFRVALQQIVVAAITLILGIAALIFTRAPQSAILFAASGWLIWMALSTCFDYQSGEILEMPLICVSVQQGVKVQNRTRVVFRTQDEDCPSYFEYFIPGRKVNHFVENYVYVLYVRKSNPKLLIGFQPL